MAQTPRAATVLSILLGLGLLAPPLAQAEGAALPPEVTEALKQAEAMAKPQNSIQVMTMTSTNKRGKVQIRQLEVKTRVEADTVRTLATVQTPEDVAGTAFLTVQPTTGEPEIYLYLPSLKRTTKVKAKRQALLGSDLSPADMDISAWAGAQHTDLGLQTAEIGGKSVQTRGVRSVPRDLEASDYPQATLYLDPTTHFPLRIDLQEADGTTVKRWEILETAKSGDATYPKRSVMSTLAKESKTELVIESMRMGVPESDVPAALFDPESLGGAKAPEESAPEKTP